MRTTPERLAGVVGRLASWLGSVIGDLGAYSAPPLSNDPFGDDARAIASDWRKVGDDMRRAMAKVDAEIERLKGGGQ